MAITGRQKATWRLAFPFPSGSANSLAQSVKSDAAFDNRR
jgi:hypothetical protein